MARFELSKDQAMNDAPPGGAARLTEAVFVHGEERDRRRAY